MANSQAVGRVIVAPGNGGTSCCGGKISNLSLNVSDNAAVVTACQEHQVELVVVGPEVPLADGIADALNEAGILCFGPSQKAAEIEASKAFSKHFMARHNIPTAAYGTFTDHAQAQAYLESVDYDVVIKASGLAAGKGVLIPSSKEEARAALKSVMVDGEFGSAGSEVVIEERMEGPEASIIAFVDGTNIVCCPAAQDHKRIGEGDTGPNTGGMGAYAPAPIVTPAMLKEICATIVQPCVDGLRAEGRPFVGCLFTGVMLTATGPKTLEYNCRFGDPETQVIMALLDDQAGDDLFTIMRACATHTLAATTVRFLPKHAATVVMASQGYPGSYPKGKLISGLDAADREDNVHVFHAGTAGDAQTGLTSSGGRVLAVTGVGDTLRAAFIRAYSGVRRISFEGAQYRRDIGHRELLSAPIRLGVLGSTRGTDMQAIIDAIAEGSCKASIELVVSNRSKAGILERAQQHGIKCQFIGAANKSREDYDALVTAAMREAKVELILLIGFMRILSPSFVQEWGNQVLNVHPSLLPKYAGGMDGDVHQAVIEAGEKETGCTIHWVDEGVDSGMIVIQKTVAVDADETPDSLKAKVQAMEGPAFLEAIEGFRTSSLPGMIMSE